MMGLKALAAISILVIGLVLGVLGSSALRTHSSAAPKRP